MLAEEDGRRMSHTTRASRLWQRWKSVARRAAVVQSNVLLWLLYYVVFVPLALCRRAFGNPLDTGSAPAWRQRVESRSDLRSARQQF